MNVTTARATDKKRKPGTILVHRAPRMPARAILQFGPLRLPAAIGRSGTTAFKREGDGATPIASMRLLHGFVRGDRVRGVATRLPLRRIRADMLWCDEPGDPCYNRLVRAPFAKSHETMSRTDRLYDMCLVLDWNIVSRRRNRGSAIFFHLADQDTSQRPAASRSRRATCAASCRICARVLFFACCERQYPGGPLKTGPYLPICDRDRRYG